MNVCGISVPFETLSPAERKITYVFLTRPPLYRVLLPFSLDLHVLSPPLTFALSQDQTLHRKYVQIFIAEDSNEIHDPIREIMCSLAAVMELSDGKCFPSIFSSGLIPKNDLQ